jgi:hypothetical protein
MAETINSFTTSVEESMDGVLDVASMVNDVLSLAGTQIDQEGVPFDLGGQETRYPLIGNRPGVKSSELCILRQTPAGPGARALALHVKLAADSQPLYIGGVWRDTPEIRVAMAFDAEDRPIRMSIHSSAQASPRNEALHVPLQDMKVVNGATYVVNLQDPNDWKMKAHGLDHMQGRSWDCQSSLVGSPWPCTEQIDELANRLRSLSESVTSLQKETNK